MEESSYSQEIDVQDFLRPKCPVEVGDRFYRKIKSQTVPDKLEVIEVKKMQNVNDGYFIKAKYLYRAIGTLERTFSDAIFKDPDWVIEKRRRDF